MEKCRENSFVKCGQFRPVSACTSVQSVQGLITLLMASVEHIDDQDKVLIRTRIRSWSVVVRVIGASDQELNLRMYFRSSINIMLSVVSIHIHNKIRKLP